jgi:hypothetical protein
MPIGEGGREAEAGTGTDRQHARNRAIRRRDRTVARTGRAVTGRAIALEEHLAVLERRQGGDHRIQNRLLLGNRERGRIGDVSPAHRDRALGRREEHDAILEVVALERLDGGLPLHLREPLGRNLLPAARRGHDDEEKAEQQHLLRASAPQG